MQFASECPQCSGGGRVFKTPCGSCNATGIRPRQRTVELNVPAGVKDGAKLRLRGQGNAGPRGGPKGDLCVAES